MSKYWKIFIGCVSVLLAALFLLFLYVIEKPVPTVDYFTRYNDLTRPESYDPKQDAGEMLRNLPVPEYADSNVFDLEMHPSHDLSGYPHKFSPEDIDNLQKWLTANRARLETIAEASLKPYYYSPVDPSLSNSEMLFHNFYRSDYSLYELSKLLSWAAVYNLYDKDTDASIRYLQAILNLHKLLRRHAGHFQNYEVNGLVDRLDFVTELWKQNLPSDALKEIQDLLISAEMAYEYDTSVTRLCFYDYVQKTFTPGDGGHLSPLVYIEQKIYGFDWSDTLEVMQCLYQSFNGERRKKTINRMEAICQRLDAFKGLPIYRLFEQGIDLESELKTLAGDNVIVAEYAESMIYQWRSPYQIACKLQAMAAMIAIERFRRDKDQYPESLEALVSAGYIDRLPKDSFSGKPLIYRKQADSFILYSVGIDGEDDGGLPALCRNCGDHLTDWGDGPVYRPGSPKDLGSADPKDARADHIFWPIMEMDRGTGQLSSSEIFPKN
jgi:hypothetical protein